MKPTLLILAAGMGSRYGGLKQVDGVGPEGEAILDYSNALRLAYLRTDLYKKRALLYQASNQHDKALRDLTWVIKRKPKIICR